MRRIGLHYWLSVLTCGFLIMGFKIEAQEQKVITSEIDSYFANLSDIFSGIAKSSSAKSTRLSTTERFFVSTLKKNQPIYSLIRTNSKGKVISEVIRGKKPERDFRDVSNQKWFSIIKNKRKDYYTVIKDDEKGRYYLFWCKPVIKRNNHFVGGIAAKIDLWDSFYKISSKTDYSFLVKYRDKVLYTNRWKNGEKSQLEKLNIPGIDNISIKYVSPAASAEVSQVQKPASEVSQLAAEEALPEKTSKSNKAFPVFIIIILIVVLLVAVSLIISKLRQQALLRKIDNSDF